MPIIINNFELALSEGKQSGHPRAESPSLSSAAGTQPPERPSEGSAQTLRPEDVEWIMQRFARRRLRLTAD